MPLAFFTLDSFSLINKVYLTHSNNDWQPVSPTSLILNFIHFLCCPVKIDMVSMTGLIFFSKHSHNINSILNGVLC